jgi:hypothetical protein
MLASSLLVLSLVGQVAANNVAPRIGYVYPPAGRAGQTLEVRLGGYDWTPDMQVFVHDPGVKIEITGKQIGPMHTPPPYWFGRSKADIQQPPLAFEFPAKLTIAPGTPAGPIRWQVANANGASAIHTFYVSDAAEVVEPEHNRSPIELPNLPAAAAGRISRITEIDEYRFTVPKAGLVKCRLDDRVGQSFSGTLQIRDAEGNLIVDAADTIEVGQTATFEAKSGAHYTAFVSDADHSGDRGFVYRLIVEQAPHVVATSPLTVARGKTTPVEVIGWGVATGANKLETVVKQANVPAAAKDDFRFEFDTPVGRGSALLVVGDAADPLEPATDDPAARQLTVGGALTGRFDKLDPATLMAVDRYQITATKGDSLRITVAAAPYGSPVDPSIAVVAADGKEIVRNDDVPLLGTTDAAVDFNVPADGVYDVIVSDLAGTQPSPANLYRLTVDDLNTAFDFTVQAPDKLDILLGGTADLVVKSQRRGAWDEPITIKLEGLPAGVTLPETAPPPAAPVAAVKGKKVPKPRKPAPGDIKSTLTAAADVACEAKPAMVVATATVEGKTIERRVGPVLVATKLKTRCVVKSAVQDGGRIVNRGTTYPADVIIERLEGYEGPVTLQQASTQSRQRRGIDGRPFVVPPGVTAVKYPVWAPEWLETSQTCRISLIGIVEIADPKGNKRFITGVMDGQIVMSIEGSILKTSHEPQERHVSLGGEIEIPIRVSRTTKLKAPVTVEVVPHEDFPELFTAEKVTLPLNQSSAVMKIRVAKDAAAVGLRNVVVRASGLQDGKWMAASQTTIPLVVENGAAVAASK